MRRRRRADCGSREEDKVERGHWFATSLLDFEQKRRRGEKEMNSNDWERLDSKKRTSKSK
jgi:hypothetical protein